MTAFVDVQHLSKTYHTGGPLKPFGRSVHALVDASFTIPKGDVFGVVGESGSGKTTLARTLLYLEPPTSGTVHIGGINVSELRHEELRRLRRKVQIVFQDPHGSLNPKLTIEDSIGEALISAEIPRRERRDRVAALLSQVGLQPEHMRRYPHAFSGGQKQRIVIARALAMNPELIVLDEPVSSLDVSIQAQIINLLLDIKEEFHLTYLFISHDLNLVSYLSDRIAVMKDGRIIEQGACEKLIDSPEHEYTRILFDSAPVFMVERRFTEGQTR